MEILDKILKKNKKLIVGLMSGTSADGVDAALVELKGSGLNSHLRLLAFRTYPYPKGFRSFLMKNSDASTARLDEITRLHILIAGFFADAVGKIVRDAGMSMKQIDLIGSHGQTVQHLPVGQKLFGKNIRGTLQIGNPSVIAKLTGIVTIGDFRPGDIAVGGSGAPLVPYFDYVMLRSRKRHRAALNIGGIANITILPKNCTADSMLAFDTGPGNMIIDGAMQRLFGKPFDRNGTTASKGKIIPDLLRWIMKNNYFTIQPPKSTGRELFGNDFIKPILSRAKGKQKHDIITTVTEATALSIFDQYSRFVRKKTRLDELYVSGGGAHNRYLMEALRRYFSGVRVVPSGERSISSDAKEAMCFALLANETLHGHTTNLPGATGARRKTILGTICLP